MLSHRRLSELVSVATIVGAAMIVVVPLALSVPVFGAVPPQGAAQGQYNFGGNATSAENRANPSGKGNFGQCLALSRGSGQGQNGASTVNPSPRNEGEADCRQVAGSLAIAVAVCPGAVAEVQLIFQPERDATARAGCNQTSTTAQNESGASPSLSPDGNKLAFVNQADLYVINADGSGLRRLANTTENVILPAWSPEGEKIAFPCPAAPGASGTDLCVINADSTEWKRIALKVAPEEVPVAVSWGRG